MFRRLFCSGNEGRSTPPSFRPTLEALESREVPTSLVSQVNAALQELPLAITNLGLNIQAQNANSRLQIDTALFTGGFQLYNSAFQLFQINDQADGNSVAQLGVQAVLSGYFDFLASNNGISQGNLTL
jgi:hypothetical protein